MTRYYFLLVIVMITLSSGTRAGDGHDHGEASTLSTGATTKPRFAVASESFELVGVLEGRQITLYLDRAADNRPVSGARIELDMNGTTLQAQPKGEGTYGVDLKAELPLGVQAITATVTVGNELDLLAAELDLHGDEHEPVVASGHPIPPLVWPVGGLVLLSLGVWAIYRRRAASRARLGGAA